MSFNWQVANVYWYCEDVMSIKNDLFFSWNPSGSKLFTSSNERWRQEREVSTLTMWRKDLVQVSRKTKKIFATIWYLFWSPTSVFQYIINLIIFLAANDADADMYSDTTSCHQGAVLSQVSQGSNRSRRNPNSIQTRASKSSSRYVKTLIIFF